MTAQRESSNLDLLRSIAVLLVFSCHFLRAAFGLPWEGTFVGAMGHLGVMAFFIHTSLVLMMSLERLAEKPGPLFRRFYIRRAFRIYPLSIVSVLLVVALHIPVNFHQTFQPASAIEIWSNIALIQNVSGARSLIGTLWSLPFEVQMYLLLPFLYLMGKRFPQPALLLGLGIALWYVDHRAKWSLLQYAPWFCMGVAAFFRRTKARLPAWLFVISLSAFVIGGLLANRFFGYRAMYAEWALGIAFSWTLPLFREIEGGVTGLFHGIAKYSYGIYLSHLPILWFVSEWLDWPAPLRIVVGASLLIAIPIAMFHLIEDPFIRLGRGDGTRWLAGRRLGIAWR